jgi:signal transduction histidine kinase
MSFIMSVVLTRSCALHRIEEEKQKRYGWWLRAFLPNNVRPGNRDERYRLGILVIVLLAIFVSSAILALQTLALPMVLAGKVSPVLMPLVPLAILLHVRKTGHHRAAALYFGLLGMPLIIIHMFALKTIYVGYFYWMPWLILFVSFLSGRRSGFMMAGLALLVILLVLQGNSRYGHDFGAFGNFATLYHQILINQILAVLAIVAMMYTLALYNDRMEAELESQHVLRAQTAHKSMIGEMLGNLAHEVNNPLAIVHSALVHYQRLLQTKRLEAHMQRGLVERMRDALDRLRLVVEDLNSSAEWSDLETPRSYASLQSDEDRPPQFGSSRLMNSREGTRTQERRRKAWIYRLMRGAINSLDRFLPDVTRSWSASQRFRARATALICTVGLIAITTNLLQHILVERVHEPVLLSGSVILAFGLVSMLVLKYLPRPQLIGLGYIVLLDTVIVGFASASGRSILVPSLHWFPILIASLFLVGKPRTALSVSLLLLIAHILVMSGLDEYGLQVSFTQMFPQYVQRLQSTLILVCCTSLVLATAFVSLMESTYGQLVAEKDWQLLSARLREVNELADSAAILIGEPLRQLDRQLKELEKDGGNIATLQRMQEAVQRINGVSQSFALLSRPKEHEGIQRMEGRVWLDHIQNICYRRAADAGWLLVTRVEPTESWIEGPPGQLTMLAITALKEAFGHRAPRPGSPLQLTVFIEKEGVRLGIQYTASNGSAVAQQLKDELEEAMRITLLQELLESLRATFERSREQDMITLELRWRPADFPQSPLL